jgi:hypothetical protein
VTNVVLVARKLAVLEEHLRRLRERRPAELAAFRADTLLQDAVALGVLVVIQEAIDIALHVASDEGWEHAASYREAFLTLERHGGARRGADVPARRRGAAARSHRARLCVVGCRASLERASRRRRGVLGICRAHRAARREEWPDMGPFEYAPSRPTLGA